MKIYFAASIRGGRENQEIHAAVIRLLQGYGQVLTEHISNVSVVGESIPVGEIYTRDRNWVTSADLVVAEVSTPSVGVGYEIGLAEAHQVPVICLYQIGSERKLSAMVEGNPYCTTLRYRDEEDVTRQLKKYFSKP